MISSEWPEQGQYIDVTDQQGRWLEGFITERKPDLITIKCITQYSKISNTISLPILDSQQLGGQYKIAPFRTHTRCNRGKINQDIKDKHKNLNGIEVRIKNLQAFAGSLRSKTGKELIQYVRGEHFLYLNCLVQQKFAEQQSLSKVNQYYSKHLELTKHYIDLMLELGLEKCFSQPQSMANEEEDAWRKELVSCLEEITDGLQKISTYFQRVVVDNNGTIKLLEWHFLHFQAGSPYAAHLLEATGCFQAIKRVIIQSGELRDRLPDFKFPIRFIVSLIQSLNAIAVNLKLDKGPYMTSLLQTIVNIIIDFFHRLEPQDINSSQLDEEIASILINISVMMTKFPAKDYDAYDLEVVRIQYCIMKIRSSVEAVQQKGIEMLTSFVKSIRMTRQRFRELIQQEHLMDLLFYDRRSSVFQRNSIIWLRLAFNSELISFEHMMDVWKKILERQPIPSLYLKQQWLEVAENITAEHSAGFIEMIRPCFSENDDIDEESHLYQLKLLESLIRSLVDSKGRLKKKEGENKELEEFINRKVERNMRILLQKQKEKQLQEIFAKIIYCWQTTNNIILLFKQLHTPENARNALFLLNAFYDQYSYRLKYVPLTFADDFIIAMKICPFTTKEVKKILSMFNYIMKNYKDGQFRKDQIIMKEIFSKYWEYFQTLGKEYRQLLYNLMLENNEFQEEEIEEQGYSPINEIFSDEIRKFINSDILAPEKFADFDRLTKKEVNIIVEFFISANIIEKRIDTKKYYEGQRSLLVRNSELIKQEMLWTVFRKCKSPEIAYEQLIPFLISFHFYFSPDFPRNLRKGRMEIFFNELKTTLEEAHSNNNTELCRMTFNLLKDLIQIVKDDKIQKESRGGFFDFQGIITIIFNGKKITPQVSSYETLASIKTRLAKRYKVSTKKLIVFDSQGQQIGFDVKELPLGRIKDTEFKVVQAGKDEETTTQFFFNCMSTSLQEVLLRLMEKEHLIADAEVILQYINIGQQCYPILSSLFANCSEGFAKGKNNRFVAMTLELLNKFIDDKQFMEKCLDSPSFSSLLKILSFPLAFAQPNLSRQGSLMSMINSCTQVSQVALLNNFTDLLVKIFKKGYKIQSKQKIAQQCMDLLFASILFEAQTKSQRIVRDKLLKLSTNWISIMEEIITIQKMFVFLFEYPKIQDLITLLFSLEYSQIKIIFLERLKKYLNQERVHPSHSLLAEKTAANIFIHGFYNKFSDSFENLQNAEGKKLSKEIFQVSNILCKVTSAIPISILDAFASGQQASFYQRVIHSISKLIETSDKKQTDTTISMLCLNLQLLRTLLNKMPEKKTTQIIDFVLDKCFGMFKDNKDFNTGKKHYIMRYLFDIITEVVFRPVDNNIQGKVMKYFIEMHNVPFWRENNKWSVANTSDSKHRFMGLINPGCICYMNSLLQQLFMIQDFRNEVTKLNTHPANDHSKEKQGEAIETPILHTLKELFLKMEHSDEKITSPVEFSRTIKNSENKPMIRINEQMDIDEFEIILFDKIEKELQLLGSKNLIRDLFGGVYSNQIISTECEHRSEREETFISISLQVKKSIFQSLKSFVKVDLLDGDNKYFCESCNKKVTAEKIQCLKKLPPFLFLCLKRFEFNFELEAKIKINEYCEFPQKLSLKQFSTEIVTPNPNNPQSNDCFDYKLRGVVVHTGSADFGHYYSYIEAKEGEWFEFNDQDVYTFDIDKLAEEAFGGKNASDDLRIRNAYMLIYERQGMKKTQEMIAEENQVAEAENKAEVERILKENADIQKYELLFSQAYDEFVQKFLKNIGENNKPNEDLNAFHSEFYEFVLSYYFLILLRKQGSQKFFDWSMLVENLLLHSKQMRIKFLYLFTSCSFIEEVFVCNPCRERCRFVAQLFSIALTFYTDETFDIDIKTNMPFIYVLTAISTSLNIHGAIPQLTLALKKYFKHLLTFHPDHFSFITQRFGFQVIYIDTLFRGSYAPSQQQYRLQLYALNKEKVKLQFFNAVEINDKKYFNNDSYYTWAILALTLQQLKTVANEPQNNRAAEMFGHLASTLAETPPAKTAIIILQSHNQRGARDLYRVYKLFNLEKKLLEGIDEGLKKYQSGRYRPFMLLIYAFLRDPQAERFYDDIISIFQNGYRHNQKYVMETELLNQWIIKLVTNNDIIMNKFREKRGFIVEIILRIKKNPSPATETLKKQRLANSQKILNRQYDILVSTFKHEYEENSHMICQWYEQVLQGKFTARARPEPTDLEFTQGMQVEYFDAAMQKWVTKEVVSRNLGRVALRTKNVMMSNLTCWEDSEKLRKKQAENVEVEEMERQENSDFSYRGEQQEEEDYI